MKSHSNKKVKTINIKIHFNTKIHHFSLKEASFKVILNKDGRQRNNNSIFVCFKKITNLPNIVLSLMQTNFFLKILKYFLQASYRDREKK